MRKWVVQPFDKDWSTYSEKYGIMRPIILDDIATEKYNLSKYAIMECGVRPPYWKDVNSRLCAIPEVQV